MRFLFTTAAKDLTRMLRDPVGLSAWIAMPFIICALVALISGGGNATPQGKLLIVDQDKSFLSGVPGQVFNRDPLRRIVETKSADYQSARKVIDAGQASALLVIPAGFSKAFLQSRPVEVSLFVNPSQRIMPVIIQDALATVLDGAFYAQKLPGSDLAKFWNADSSSEAGHSVNRAGREAAPSVFPPLIKIETQVLGTKQEQPSLVVLFYPGFLMLAVFGLAQANSEDLWKERSMGTLRRIRTTPRSLALFLAGKLLALSLLFTCIAAAGLALAHVAIQAPMNNVALAILWVTTSGVMLYLMAALLQVASTEQRTGVMLNALVLFVLAMAGGTFFPFELMPAWLARIGRFTPNGWAISHFKSLVASPADAASTAFSFAMVILFSAVAFLFLTRVVRRWSV